MSAPYVYARVNGKAQRPILSGSIAQCIKINAFAWIPGEFRRMIGAAVAPCPSSLLFSFWYIRKSPHANMYIYAPCDLKGIMDLKSAQCLFATHQKKVVAGRVLFCEIGD